MKFRHALMSAVAISAAALGVQSANAAAVLGAPISVATNGHVIATFVGSDAGYTSTIQLVDPTTSGVIFQNNGVGASAIGSTYDLGYFHAGDVLTFLLNVITTSTGFYTGDGVTAPFANPDGIPHATVEDLGGGLIQVAFEDKLGGGDRDYNDLIFSFQTGVPEPTSWALMISGFGLVGAAMRRRSSKMAVTYA